MFAFIFYHLRISKFATVVGLDLQRFISEIGDSAFNKIDRDVTVNFFIWINKSFSSTFVDYRILIKPFIVYNVFGKTVFGNVFYV